MCSTSKNGKQYINYINRGILVIIAAASLIMKGFAPAESGKDGWIIVIDAGHGGRDPGAIGSSSFEKNITLAVALKTGKYIEENIKNTKVIYTRKTDILPDLSKRAEIANKNKADLFISIHVNGDKTQSTHGTETYVMGHSKDDQNLAVAMKENSVILLEKDYSTKYEGFDPNSPESYIMFTLMQNAYTEQSTDLASKIQQQYKDRVNRADRGVKQAGFWVLYMCAMPSVLTEIGYITNPTEERYLNSEDGQDYIASAIYRACRDYITEIDRKSIISTVQVDTERVTESATQNPAPDDKILFMVQITSSGRKVEIKPQNFRNIKDVIEIPSGHRFKYATGSFDNYDSALAYRKKIEVLYPDAFVIAVRGNKILPLQEALGKK
jgi:N-acetylmuramoyl-L-alanine amidase